ncbi:DgyrCDS11880 [Dimorphilus gyrociliatus]|uniref:DgyrCDS11880 n=1 Tax=Dimorphilus gyrociliatus TaxID=2664684 RepID=A0A7I8W7A7_9ANNE|nr:DgyrCDS11880 [Dimorphilus gyrociliatus]
MAVSLDDKLLGEKAHYYCSSSEDEGESENLAGGPDKGLQEPPMNELKEYATNTGPKGVINDFRRYKQLENEKREEQELERLDVLKKIQLTCRSELDDKKEKEKDEQFELNLEDLLEDEFLKEYRQKRIEEMRKRLENVPRFGKVIALTKENFLDNIDKEDPSVKIVIHLYEDDIPGCEAMNGCLQCLAKEYQSVKFCLIKASSAKLSTYFVSAYKINDTKN